MVEMSVYSYVPQTVQDERTIEVFDPKHMLAGYSRLESSLAAGKEIAFHSRVIVGRGHPRTAHIPMIDFTTDKLLDQDRSRVIDMARSCGVRNGLFFHSGRSYHFYGLALLRPAKWRYFMLRAQLLNLPGCPDLVDTRWIAHRLIAGYGSLRWTRNTNQYVGAPRLVPQSSEDAQLLNRIYLHP
jgi:hypothetical protein